MKLTPHEIKILADFYDIPVCIIEWRLMYGWPIERIGEKTHDLPDQY